MSDSHYPSVSIYFIDSQMLKQDRIPKIDCVKRKGTTMYVVNGTKALHKRQNTVRLLENDEVCFEQAMSLAIQFRFLNEMSLWLLENKNFKDGGYITS